jgi:CBS domain-containing protein
MLVSEIMTTNPVTVTVDESPARAVDLMAACHLSSLPVLDNRGALAGIVTEGDLLRYAISPDPRAHLRPQTHWGIPLPPRVEAVMTPRPRTTREAADVRDVARTLSESAWRILPVLRSGRLVGVVSRSDVVRALAHPDRDVERSVRDVFGELGHAGWSVHVVDGVAHVGGTEGAHERAAASALAAEVSGVRGITHEGHAFAKTHTTHDNDTTQEVAHEYIA